MRRTVGKCRTQPLVAVALAVTVSLCTAIPRAGAQSGTAGVCFCDEGGAIAITQLIGGVNIALGREECPMPASVDVATLSGQVAVAGICYCGEDGTIAISQLVRAVNVALGQAQCPALPPTPAPSLPASPTVTATETPTATATQTATPTATVTATSTTLSTASPTATATATGTPTDTPTASATATSTGTPTATATATSTATATPTATPTASATFTATNTPRGLVDLGVTVVDLDSGLEWVKSDDDGGITDKDNTYTWTAMPTGQARDGSVFTEYLRGLNDLAYAGHRDWRLPTSAGSVDLPTGEAAELESLVDCRFTPCLDPLYGPPPSDSYWSESSLGIGPRSAWSAVVFTGAIVANDKSNDFGARAVREIQRTCAGRDDGTTCDAGMDGVVRTCTNELCAPCTPLISPSPRYVDNLDGTVTDRGACLVWEMKNGGGGDASPCPGGASCDNPHDVDNLYTWSDSGSDFDGGAKTSFLDLLNDVAGGGTHCFADHCDWRLPSEAGRNTPFTGSSELESLLSAPFPCAVGPPCIAAGFGPTASGPYWSSTTSADDAAEAWSVDFSDGNVDARPKASNGHVRAVRGSS